MQFLGGHTHIRDYAKYDKKAYALESGRYMETIGFQSISGLSTGGEVKDAENYAVRVSSPQFGRRYIDNNLFSFYHHTGLNQTTFPTAHGRNVSASISSARKSLKLDQTFGCAPRDYWTNRAPFPSENSIFSWMQEEVLPDMIKDPERGDSPRMVLTNTGALRFDIFKGPFTVDTTYTVSPFTSGFRYIKDVPFSVAKRLLQILNQEVPQLWPNSQSFAFKSPIDPDQLRTSHAEDDSFYHSTEQKPFGIKPEKNTDQDLTPGYTTTDDAGSDGDDTIHSPITFYRVPNCLESRIGFPASKSASTFTMTAEDPESVDLIYVDFIESYVLLALKFLATDYAEKDTEVYMEGKDLTGVIAEWVKGHWECE